MSRAILSKEQTSNILSGTWTTVAQRGGSLFSKTGRNSEITGRNRETEGRNREEQGASRGAQNRFSKDTSARVRPENRIGL